MQGLRIPKTFTRFWSEAECLCSKLGAQFIVSLCSASSITTVLVVSLNLSSSYPSKRLCPIQTSHCNINKQFHSYGPSPPPPNTSTPTPSHTPLTHPPNPPHPPHPTRDPHPVTRNRTSRPAHQNPPALLPNHPHPPLGPRPLPLAFTHLHHTDPQSKTRATRPKSRRASKRPTQRRAQVDRVTDPTTQSRILDPAPHAPTRRTPL